MSDLTHRGRLAIKNRESKVVENRKKSLFIKGRKFPSTLQQVWDDLALFRHGEIEKYVRENQVNPFEPSEVEELEKYCQRTDCSLFTFASHNKKRPNNLVFGRLYNFKVLDMYEFGVTEIVDHKDLKPRIDPGWVPALIFQGEQWDTELQHLRSYFMDYFVGDLHGRVNLDQVQHCIVFTYIEEDKTILFRHYFVKREGGTTSLELAAPSFNLVRRREQLPDEDMLALAMQTGENEKKPKKKTHIDELGREVGKVYVGKNDMSKIQPKKFVGLPKRSEREIVQEAEVDLV